MLMNNLEPSNYLSLDLVLLFTPPFFTCRLLSVFEPWLLTLVASVALLEAMDLAVVTRRLLLLRFL